MKNVKNILLLTVIQLFFLFWAGIYAQQQIEGLVFSEIYLDKDKPENNWIEISNIHTIPLVLEQLRFSNVLTTNILPLSIQKEGGITINPGKSLVICASLALFPFYKNISILEIPAIKACGAGGFFALRTQGYGQKGRDYFHFGNPPEPPFKSLKVNQVIPFIENNSSYSLTIQNRQEKQGKKIYSPTITTPGYFENH